MDCAKRNDVKAGCCGIAVMAKASVPGLTKTRLVPPLTYGEAAALNTAFLQDVTENILLAAGQTVPGADIVGYAAYGPPGSTEFFHRNLSTDIGLIEVWLPDFGDCLLRTIQEIFARGHAAAVVLNADSPTLPTALLRETAEALARPGDRAVLGPADDGGYYLLGLKAPHRRLFEEISWSTAQVADQTRERARETSVDLHVLPAWYDVDDLESLRRLHAELCPVPAARNPQNAPALQPHPARHTTALLQRLWPDGEFSRGGEQPMQIEKAAV